MAILSSINSSLTNVQTTANKKDSFTLINGVTVTSGGSTIVSTFDNRNIDEYDMISIYGIVNPDTISTWTTNSTMVPHNIIIQNIPIEASYVYDSSLYYIDVVRVNSTQMKLINSNSGLNVKIYVFGINKL